ncbi:hypothetical protein GY45DRAFT_1317275 [Cubamyces sp. BRFM 1775]|nr:hypothetical protein GY45DRAFT_1317275 [Cubamyces sp. BRFM 1775]
MNFFTSWVQGIFHTYPSRQRRPSADVSPPPPALTEVTFTLPWLDHIPESKDSSFYKALSAPHTIYPHGSHSPQESFINAVEWTPPPSPDVSDSSESEDVRERMREATEIIQAHLDGLISAFNPDPVFAWAKDRPLTDIERLRQLTSGGLTSVSLKKGRIGRREVTYISKSWTRRMLLRWDGLFTELKLYASPRHLGNIQGFIVPPLMKVHQDAAAVSLVLQPPHRSFWIEASADMPNVLKKEIILTYVALHDRGILHGDAELHNMLIGGDGRITLMHFHAARVRHAGPGDSLPVASRSDFAMELRRVMFKLDYEGARAREHARRERFEQHALENLDRQSRGEPEISMPIEELQERPPSEHEWRSKWINGLDTKPRRFIIPGQSPEELVNALESFCKKIKLWDALDAQDMVSPLIVPSHSMPPAPPPLPRSDPPLTSPAANSMKRKMDDAPEASQPPVKRARGRGSVAEDGDAPAPPRYERSSTTYDTGTSDKLLPASSEATAEPKVDRVRDFAYEPYDGPRGYYFPDPPGEALQNTLRAVHLRNANAVECGRQGLPYSRFDRKIISPPSFKRLVPRGLHVSQGALKRQREATEHPTSVSEQREAKRRRFEEDRAAALAEDRPVRFSDEVSYHDPPQYLDEDDHEYDEEGTLQNATAGPQPPMPPPLPRGGPIRPILKRTRPVKTVSYDAANWMAEFRTGSGLGYYIPRRPAALVEIYEHCPIADPSGVSSNLPDTSRVSPQASSSRGTAAGGRTTRTDGLSGISGSGSGDRVPLSQRQPGPANEHGAAPMHAYAVASPSCAAVAPPTDAASMVRNSDAPSPARDPRSKTMSAVIEWSHYFKACSSEDRDLEEEAEVEAMLFAHDPQR